MTKLLSDDELFGGSSSGNLLSDEELFGGGAPAPSKPRSVADVARDVGVTALKGAVGLPQAVVGLADIPTGGRVGKALEELGYRPEDAKKMLDGMYSEAQQEANRQVREADGFVPTLQAALENPSTIATTVGESLPQMLGGAGIARGIMAAAPKVAPWLAAAVGEGVLGAGSAASQIRSETKNGLLAGEQALSAVGSGVGTGLLGAAGGKLAQKMGVLDVDTMLATGKLAKSPAGFVKAVAGAGFVKAVAGFVKAVAGAGISEGVFEELPQSVQEQMWQNFALDKPLTKGVGNAAALGLLAGASTGGAGGGFNAAMASLKKDEKDGQDQAAGADATAQSQAPPAASASDVLGVPQDDQKKTEAEQALYEPKSITALDRVSEIDKEIQTADPAKAVELQSERDNITRTGLLNTARGEQTAPAASPPPAPAPVPAATFDFDAIEQSLTEERDATTNEIEDGRMRGGDRRRKTPLEWAIYDAVTTPTLTGEEARAIFDVAAAAGRLDLAEYAVRRAERAAESMGTTPGVSKDSPKYEAIKKDLERRKAEAIAQAAELRRALNERKNQQRKGNNAAQPAQMDTQASQANDVQARVEQGASQQAVARIDKQSVYSSPDDGESAPDDVKRNALGLPEGYTFATGKDSKEKVAASSLRVGDILSVDGRIVSVDNVVQKDDGTVDLLIGSTGGKSTYNVSPDRILERRKIVKSETTAAETKPKTLTVGAMPNTAPGKSGISKGAAGIAQRQANAANNFIDSVQEQFGLSKEDAGKAWDHFVQNKLVKIDAVGGQYSLTDGRLWDGEVMRRAASGNQAQSKAKSNRRQIDATKDTLFQAIAKLGGMDTQELTSNGFDPKDITYETAAKVSKKTGKLGKKSRLPRSLGFNMPLHKKGGMSFDGMLEALKQHGYFLEGATKNDAIEAFRRELGGDAVVTPDAEMRRMEEDQAARDAEQLAEQEANDAIGYDDLNEREKALVDFHAETIYDEDNPIEAFRRGMKSAGATEEEINEAIKQTFGAQETGDNDSSRAAQRTGEDGNAQGVDNGLEDGSIQEGAEPDWLTGQTNEQDDTSSEKEVGRNSVSEATYKNWIRQLGSLGKKNGWDLFRDNITGQYVLMSRFERAGSFDNIDAATKYANSNKAKTKDQVNAEAYLELTGQTNEQAAAELAKRKADIAEEKRQHEELIAKAKRESNAKEKARRAAQVLAEREAAKKAEVDKAAEDFALGQAAPAPVDRKVTTEDARGQQDVFAQAKYAGPADVSSRAGQMELSNRAVTIAALKGMNEQLRKIAPDEAWADRNIEDAQNLDALRDQISQALVDANRGKPDVNPLRKELEELSGQELKDVFSKLNLAGKLMAYEERISALLMEDAAEVRAAISAVTGNPSESTAQPVKATTEAKAVEPAQDGDWLSALFNQGTDSTKEDTKAVAQAVDKSARVDAAIAMLTGEIEANNAVAAELAARKYKQNKKQIELVGDGPGKNGSMSISAINESRRRRSIEAAQNTTSAMKKAIEFISENPDDAFKQVLDMESAVTKQFNEGFFGKSAKIEDQLDMAVGSLIGASQYSGKGSAGRKLRMAAHAYFADDKPAAVDAKKEAETDKGIALMEESAVYNVNEPDAFTGDIFQGTEHALPETKRRAVPAGQQSRGRSDDGQGASRVLAVREAADTPGVYHVSAQLVTVGERQLPVATVKTSEDAARAFAHLSRFAVEHMDGLVTDKDGRPLAIIGAFKGAPTQASVYSSTLMMELARIDGAANLWLSHNHPSGMPNLSEADRSLSRNFRKILRDTSITYQGLSAMARRGNTIRWEDDDYNSGEVQANEPAPHRVPIVERELVNSNPVSKVGGPQDAKRLVPELAKGSPGVVFLTAQNEIASFVPFSPEEMGELRSGSRLMKLFNAAAKSGATGALVAMPDGKVTTAQFGNLKGALGTIDVGVFDGIRYDSAATDGGKSVAESGEYVDSVGANFFSRGNGATQGQSFPRAQAESRIKSILGDKLGKVLIDSGIVTFTNKGNEYQGATYKDGSIVLNLDALSADNFDGIFAHEGFHSAIRDLVGEQTYAQMMKRLDNMRALGNGGQWFKDANAAIPSDTKAEHRTEEIAAYSIEQYVNGAKQPNVIKRWVESLLSALRTAIIRRLPSGKLKSWAVNNLQPQDLANLAIAGLKAKARGQLQAQGREAMALSRNENGANVSRMADKDTVAGTQAPTSVSDGSTGSAKAPHIAAAEQILSLMDDPVYTYGLRVLPSDFTDPVKPRETIPSSFVWQDGDITDEEINGVSTAGIRRSDLESVLAAMKNLGVTGKNGPNGYYFGSRVVLVRGDSNGSGQDVGETIIRDPEVLGEWKKPNNGLSEVMPNEPSASAGSDATRLSRSSQIANKSTVVQRAEEIINKSAATWRPVDAIMRGLTHATRFDRATGALYDMASKLLDRVPEQIKAGVVSDYGVPEAVIDRRVQAQGRMRVQMRKAGELIDKLSTLTRAESRVAYEWMNNNDPQALKYFEAQLPEESVKVMEEVKGLIDQLSQEAVSLGQLSEDAFKHNRFEYLRRSYVKHTAELTKGETEARRRAIAILGDQYKGRGMTDSVDMAKFRNVAPEWWGRKLKEGQADKGLKGEKFIRLERRKADGAGVMPLEQHAGPGDTNPKKTGKLLEVVYWPAGEALPAKFADWENAGTWEVRDTKGKNLIVWRDFTKQERIAMGEIDEARYAIAKTLHGMIHDVETGRYLDWLATTYAKKPGEAIDGEIIEASERMRDTFKPGTWVQVPETKIPGTSVVKYGKLAGRYIPGPIWNDVRQTVGFRFKPLGETYAAILGAWKTAKTALSPAVHTNNVMANFVMADWHDVTAGHVLKALRILLGASERDGKGLIGRAGNVASRAGMSDAEAAREVMNRYQDSGGNIGTWAVSELQKDQLEPLLAAMEKELGLAGETAGGQVGVWVALQKALQLRFPSAWEAFKPSLPGRVATTEARNLISLYEAEDQVFRLAAWLKAKEEGASDIAAGKVARKSFLDYHINAPWIQAMRNTAFPFVSFTYRSVPMLIEIAAKKPHKLMKLALVAAAVNALGYMMSGGDEDDERKLLPEEKAGKIWGLVPKLVRMPWNDKFGDPVFLDIRRFVPVGDIFDTGSTNSAMPILPAMVPGGPLAILAELALNKTQFTGKPITLETDSPDEKAVKIADYLYKSLMPNVPVVPGTYSWTGITNASKGKTDSFGRELSTPQAVASAFGVKLGSYPKDVLMQNLKAKEQADLMEVQKNIRQLKREHQRNGIDDAEFEKKMADQFAKQVKIKEDFQKRINGQ